MRDTDLLTRQFLSNKTVFADICNIVFHDGRHVIKEEHLRGLPARVESAPDDVPKSRAIVCERDVVMEYSESDSSCSSGPSFIIALEAQTAEDRAMPFRMAMYEVLEYKGQLDALRHTCKRRSKNGGDFISMLPPGKLLVPVVSAVVYFGTRPWSKNTRLQQMMKVPGGACPDKCLHDYKALIFSLCSFTDEQLRECRPALVCVAKSLRYAGDKRLLRKKLQEDPVFAETPVWVVPIINRLVGLKIDVGLNNDKETMDMCRAAREMMADIRKEGKDEGMAEGIERGMAEGIERGMAEGIERGMAEGIERGMAEGIEKSIRDVASAMTLTNAPKENIVSFLMRAFSLSAEAASSYLV